LFYVVKLLRQVQYINPELADFLVAGLTYFVPACAGMMVSFQE